MEASPLFYVRSKKIFLQIFLHKIGCVRWCSILDEYPVFPGVNFSNGREKLFFQMLEVRWTINFYTLRVDEKRLCHSMPCQCSRDHDFNALTIALVAQVFDWYVSFFPLK